MRTIKPLLLINMLLCLLLVSANGYAVTAAGAGSQASTTQATDSIRYVTAELLALHPDKIVTSQGTYSTLYIPVLDQRIPGVYSGKRVNKDSKGKVQLKMDKENQLMEVVIY